MQNMVKGGRDGVTWPTLRILGTLLYIGHGWS